MNKFISLIFLAGGSGTRFGGAIPKQFMHLQGKPVFRYSLDLFVEIDEIAEIVVVCDPSYRPLFDGGKKLTAFALPGPERKDSVYNGFQEVSPNADLVLIHDSARPFVERSAILQVIEAGFKTGAAALASPAVNTIKQCHPSRLIEKTLDRTLLWEMQTPQTLRPELLREGFQKFKDCKITDDISLAELLGYPAEVVPSSPRNFKITTPFDWQLAELIVNK